MPEEEPDPAQEEMEQGETASPHAAEPSFLIQLDEADARINLISMVPFLSDSYAHRQLS